MFAPVSTEPGFGVHVLQKSSFIGVIPDVNWTPFVVVSARMFAGASDREIDWSGISFPVSISFNLPLAETLLVSTTLVGRRRDKDVECFCTLTIVEFVAIVVVPLLKYAVIVLLPMAAGRYV